jgi:nitrogen fixation/metabolism regulation signal transduction histidine kinase
MRYPQLSRVTRRALPVGGLLALLLISLHLMSSAVQNTLEMNRLFVPLLLFILIGLAALLLVVAVNLFQLLSRYRRRTAGSRLTLRMVLLFVSLALAPVSIVFYYSQQFLLRGIDSWFNVEIDRAMEDALALSQASLDLHKRERLRNTQRLLGELQGVSAGGLTISLDQLRERYGASELALMEPSGQVITSSNADPTILVPDRPEVYILDQVRSGQPYLGLAPGREELLQVRVVVHDPVRGFILQALYPTTPTIGELTLKVQDAYSQYKELAYLRRSLKSTFTLTLALVLLFSLLGAVWAAFFSARRLVAPVANLAEGTRAVAAGDYDKQLPLPPSHDELGFLVASFNTMTRRLAQARDAAEHSQRQVEAERSYLETVLSRLSSGVMTFDTGWRLHTANPAAHDILHLPPGGWLGRSLEELAAASPQMQQLLEALQPVLAESGAEWRGEVNLLGGEGRQILLCRSTPLSLAEHAGLVLVIEDVTALLRAQRDAAWGEVARRLAHEIKNPLTPIQLSSERLRHKLLRRLEGDDAQVLERATHTIIQQVEAMKEMVNAFSDYARPPKHNPQSLRLDQLVRDVLDLYQHNTHGPVIELELAAEEVRMDADPLRIRQVVHNLVKNAQDALEGHPDPHIQVATRCGTQGEFHYVELCVNDNGAGFDDEVRNSLFEPYFTTKVKGTGLGLAIVRRIVEEHGGLIWAENRPQGGASIILRLPLGQGSRCHGGREPATAGNPPEPQSTGGEA